MAENETFEAAPRRPHINGKVQKWLKSTRDEDGDLLAGNWVASIMPHLRLLETSSEGCHSSVSFVFTVQPEHCNRMHSLHGGCIATIFDFTTTMVMALVTRPGFWQSMGVSRSLNVTYLRPAAAGTELLIECEIVQVGKTLATLKGIMRTKKDGRITATCEHGKVNNDSRSHLS
ncbi:hypothetical protein PV08_09023 [Exophiala spinifera]|uniref:Thioesterase domain-containing protein n=1 Tax=Exophiala spinifera TaxID=91928 RepID=A0A0D1Y9W3_9EURO|nr:uncharacterized protein PV08_09023 [Exophiala spinifera]KIW11751.1 hypothetical protein PV08_09023 [Exophiala spinifera]